MPVINPKDSGSSNQQRATFRPPWVKDGPSPLPMPAAPWTPRSREANASTADDKSKMEKPVLRKQTKITIPIEPPTNQNTTPRAQEKVIPIKVVHENSSTPKAQPKPPAKPEDASTPSWRKERPTQQPASNSQSRPQERTMTPTANKPPPPPAMPSNAPPPPPMMGAPPPPPPMTDSKPPINRQPLTQEKAAKIEALRSRPRRRPDWSDMMKEVESGKKLKHVQCNDRSAPIIPQMKAKGQFVYESEKKGDDGHNKLLKQIQTGVKLKKVKCNDRSKPNLDGLRKFRRQMTIEEQLQKSVSMADVVAAAVQPDELDDIDKVRDDLQSAKQMLALELRNKEAIERENKRLAARLANLEVELEKEKALRMTDTEKGHPVRTDEDEKLIVRLKEEAAEASRIAKDMEQKYHTTAEQLDNTRRKLESAWLRNQELELQLKSVSQGTPVNQLMRQPSKKFIPIANGASVDLISDDEEEETETESEESENEGAATAEKQIARELKLLTTKLKTFREKQAASLKERRILREQLKKKQKELKDEKNKYKLLQKEVDKMAKLMKEADEDDYDEEETEEEEETESESESEESEEEEQSDEELPRDAGIEEKRKFLLERTKRHENRLSSLKKGNNLMKANIERLQDDLNKQREMSLTLQEDLNNILADLG